MASVTLSLDSVGNNEQTILSKSCELSLYELQRRKQDAITDNTEIAVSPRSLNSELMCPICLDKLKKTMATKECLHRFCSDCIITALRKGIKRCPTCRKKMVSKRCLRPDPNFDLLIAKIYSNREERCSEAKRGRLGVEAPCPNEEEEVEVIFKPHPVKMEAALLSRLSQPTWFIKTTGDATVQHLALYLSTRMTLELNLNESEKVSFRVHVLPSGGDYTLLHSKQSLDQINASYWKADRPLELFYSTK